MTAIAENFKALVARCPELSYLVYLYLYPYYFSWFTKDFLFIISQWL